MEKEGKYLKKALKWTWEKKEQSDIRGKEEKRERKTEDINKTCRRLGTGRV